MKIMKGGDIHPTAIIGSDVKIGKNVTIYPYVVIEGNVVIEDNVTIHSFTNISHAPEHKTMPMKEDGRVFVGEGATLFQHTAITMPTVSETYIGKHSFLMGGAHIGHDCKVMDHAIVGGNGMMAGHSILGEGAFLGDSATIHQWEVVGAYCMIGMNTPVRHNVLPFTIAYGSPPFWKEINRVGLERSPIPKEQVEFIKEFYSIGRQVNIIDLETLMWTLNTFKEQVTSNPVVKRHFDSFTHNITSQQGYPRSNTGRMIRQV